PPAMLEHHARPPVGRLEADLDLGHMAAVVEEVIEHQPLPRLPCRDAAEVVALARLLVPHLDPTSADAGLEPDADRALRVLPPVRTALVPGADLLGDHLECRDGVDADLDARGHGVGRAHRARRVRVPRRSAWALNAPSCSLQNAST